MEIFNKLGVEDGEQIEHKMLSGAIEKAQQRIESDHFGTRKRLLEYDQVMNEQREIIYEERRRVLDGESMRDAIYNMLTEYVERTADRYASPEVSAADWDIKGLNIEFARKLMLPPVSFDEVSTMSQMEFKHMLKERAVKGYEAKEAEFPEPEMLREIERVVLLKSIDRRWMDHIDDMDQSTVCAWIVCHKCHWIFHNRFDFTFTKCFFAFPVLSNSTIPNRSGSST